MAINKTINKRTTSHAAMRNCIEYVLKEHKTNSDLIYVTGPAPDIIKWNTVYNTFLEEKRLWRKDNGRMYNHNIISFHKDEKITLQDAFFFGKEFAEKWFPNHQTLVSVHKDKNHIHIHLVTNTVSFVDGKKLHNTKSDMEKMKAFTNEMCQKRNLSITQKGRHFDGSKIEDGTLIAWSKDKYHQLLNEQKKSYVSDCGLAVLSSIQNCSSKDEFIEQMKINGWNTQWTDARKHLTFINDKGQKVRDTNLSKTFNLNIRKEELINEFKRQVSRKTENSRDVKESQRRELEQYYRELEWATVGEPDNRKTKGSDRQAIERKHRAYQRQRTIHRRYEERSPSR